LTKNTGIGHFSPIILQENVKFGKYDTVRCPAILMHANMGITFDLEAIHAILGVSRIVGFSGLCGISNNVPESKKPYRHLNDMGWPKRPRSRMEQGAREEGVLLHHFVLII